MLSIFSYVSGPSVCPPWRSVCSGPLLIFNWISYLLGVELCEFFIYFGDQTLVRGIIGKYVFPYSWFSFILVLFSLAVQKLFILMRSRLFILSFMSLALGYISVKYHHVEYLRISCLYSPLGLHGVMSYIKVFYPFWVYFCVWCKLVVKFHFFFLHRAVHIS